MDIERARRMAELTEARDSLGKIEVVASGLLGQLRLATDPLMIESVAEIRATEIVNWAIEIKDYAVEARRLSERIARLKDALGE